MATRELAPDKGRQLVQDGFVVVTGPYCSCKLSWLSNAFDTALASADPSDVRVSSSTRAWDIVTRTPDFVGVYTHPPLLEACRLVLGDAFKLSATCFRALNAGAPSQALHVDAAHQADGWPILGFILMVDPFTPENGATRFVRGSHHRHYDPGAEPPHAHDPDVETLACAPAGALVIFNGSTWRAHGNNTTHLPRRSIQGHFIQPHARAAIDYGARLSPEARKRIGIEGEQVLGLTSSAWN